MFETQRRNYNRYSDLSDRKLQYYSENVIKKYDSVQKKTKELKERMNDSIEDHKLSNYERFSTKSVNYDRKQQERLQFIKREEQRHMSRSKLRENILGSINSEHERKKELNKLRMLDARAN